MSGGPDRARTAQGRKAVVYRHTKSGQSQTCIPARDHAGRACMILFTCEADPVLPDTDDRRDNADCKAAGLKRVALLDMGFQISKDVYKRQTPSRDRLRMQR